MPLVALVVTALATAIFVWRTARSGRGIDLAAATLDFAAGLLMASLAAAHSATVAVVAARRAGPFIYDFRFYALLLLGAVLIALALAGLLAAPGVARGDRGARRRAMLAAGGLLLVTLPLMPLQGFAIGFAVISLLNLGVLTGVGFARPSRIST